MLGRRRRLHTASRLGCAAAQRLSWYAPPLIVEVLSPSNTPAKIERQRIVAMSAGTQEFWVVDREHRAVHITNATGTRLYAVGDSIELPIPLLTVESLTFEKH